MKMRRKTEALTIPASNTICDRYNVRLHAGQSLSQYIIADMSLETVNLYDAHAHSRDFLHCLKKHKRFIDGCAASDRTVGLDCNSPPVLA
jgi:hypothetical protein